MKKLRETSSMLKDLKKDEIYHVSSRENGVDLIGIVTFNKETAIKEFNNVKDFLTEEYINCQSNENDGYTVIHDDEILFYCRNEKSNGGDEEVAFVEINIIKVLP